MVKILCSNCKGVFSTPVELWWGSPEAGPKVVQCPHCKVWNIVTFILSMEAKVHGIVNT